jgi:Tol biopolymer transport system component
MWSPDGRELWYEHVLPGRAASIMKALDLASGSVREMFRLPPQSGAISLNADASRMAFMRPGSGVGSVEFVVAETGQTDGQVVATLKGSEMLPRRGPEISPGGDRVLYVVMGPRSAGAREGTIWVVGSDGTGARKLKEVPGIRSAMWDPSGRFVAYTARTDTTDTVLRVVDVATASEHDIPVPSTRNSYYLQDWSLDGRFIGFLRVDYWWEYWAVRGLLEGGG